MFIPNVRSLLLACYISYTQAASYANTTTTAATTTSPTFSSSSAYQSSSSTTQISGVYSVSSTSSLASESGSTSAALGSYILAGINGVSSSSLTPQYLTESTTSDGAALSLSSSGIATSSAAESSASAASSSSTSISLNSAANVASNNVSSAPPANVFTTSLSASQSSTHNASMITTSNIEFGNVTIAPTGSGYEYASSCNALLLAWSNSSEAARQSSTRHATLTLTSTLSEEMVSSSLEPAVTTLCDGVPRVLGGLESLGPSYTAAWTTEVFTLTDRVTSWDNYNLSVPRPQCTINTQDCSSLWSVFAASQSTAALTARATLPACDYEAIISQSMSSDICASCTISANGVQLSYWPPNIIGSPCAANRTTISATPTRPGFANSRVIGNMTYVSPTVYLAFTYVAAPDGEAGYCGNVVESTVIPLAPDDVSSVRFKQLDNCTTCHDGPTSYTIQGIYPVNYADFSPGMVPLAAYQGMAACVGGGCNTITEASYSPFLSVPQQLKSMQSIWSDCVLFVDGVWDPPIALQPVESEAGVTTSVPPGSSTTSPSIPAEPVSTLTSPIASSTAPVATPYNPVESTSTASISPIESPTQSSSSEDDSSQSDPSIASTYQASAAPAPYTIAVTSSVQVVVVSSNVGQSQDSTEAAPQSYTDPSPQQSDPGTTNALSILSAAETSSQDPVIAPASSEEASTEDSSPPALSTATQAVVSIAGSLHTIVQSGSVAAVGSQKLTVGADPITVQGQTVSLASNGVVVDSATATFTPAAVTPAPMSQAIVSVQGSAYTVAQSGSVAFIGSQKITVGGDPATLGGQIVSLASNGIVAGGVGGQSFTALSEDGSVVLMAASTTTTVAQNGVATLNGQVMTVASDGLLVGSSSIQFSNVVLTIPTATQQAVITAGSHTISAIVTGSSVVLMDGLSTTTVPRTGIATFDGQTFSAGVTGIAVNGGPTVAYSFVAASPIQAIVTVGGASYTAIQSGSVIVVDEGSSTLSLAAGDPATLGGEIVSALSGGSGIVIGGSTVPLTAMPAQTSPGLPEEVLTIGGITYTAVASSQNGAGIILEDGSSTIDIEAGAVETVQGQTVSVLSNGMGLVVDGTSTAMLTSAGSSPAVSSVKVTISGQAFTVIQGSGVQILEDATSTMTLPDGKQTTFAGQIVSAASTGGMVVVDGTVTATMEAAASTRSSLVNTTSSDPASTTGSGLAGTTSSTKSAASRLSQQPTHLALLWGTLLVLSMAITVFL